MKPGKMLTLPLKMSIISLALAFALSAANAGQVTEFFVDANDVNAADTPDEGRGSADLPFKTIQAAITNAAAGATIFVRPGVYDAGGAYDGYMWSRLVIDRKVRIQATGSRDETHIVGRHSTAAGAVRGIGEGAIRCIYAADSAADGTEIRGFTIRDGASATTEDTRAGSGSGLYAQSVARKVYLIDCVVSNCVATRGGGLLGGTAIRSLVTDNDCTVNGAAGRSCGFWNCVIANNAGNTVPVEGCHAVNCTVFGNGTGGTVMTDGATIRNCIVVGNTKNGSSLTDVKGSVFAQPNDVKVTAEDGLEGAVLDAPQFQLFAPAHGDFRVVAGSVAAANGRASYLASSVLTVPDGEKYLDYHGNPIPTEGTICAGCLQETAVPAGGLVVFAGSQESYPLFGSPVKVSNLWAYPESYPTQFHVRADMKGRPIYCYSLGSTSDTGNYRPPEMDDSFYVMPPPEVTGVVTCETVYAHMTDSRYNVFYVDCGEKGDDGHDGWTPDTPFKTLQRAVTAAPSGYKRTVVYVAGGTYGADQGSVVAKSHNTRVSVDQTSYIRFKGAGAGVSVIEGAKDTSEKALYGGCGPAACRCAYFLTASVLQGFTLRTGYTSYKEGEPTASDNCSNGGGVLGQPNTMVADCTITDCAGIRGGFGNGGSYWRCCISDCYGWNGCERSATCFSSCRFANLTGNYGIIYSESGVKVVHCTGVAVSATQGNVLIGNNIPVWDSILTVGGTPSFKSSGNVLWKYTASAPEVGFIHADPLFVSESDFHVLELSPAVTAGLRPSTDNYGTNYYLYATSDLEGRPLRFVDNAPVAGCFQRTASAVLVPKPRFGSVTPAGTNAVAAGGSLTVTYENTEPARPFLGFAVNGERVLPPSDSLTLTAPVSGDGKVFDVEILCETNWYVDASRPDDDGDGFTPETAKRTLRAIFEDTAVADGDCVHAAAGEYAEGAMVLATPQGSGSTGCTSNRVVVSAGVMLVADAGADATVIRGRKALSGADSLGRGPGALRCVFLENRARLIGFTVADGAVALPTGDDNDDTSAGGILSRSTSSADLVEVRDCIITNCSGYRAGGMYRGRAVNCRFIGNWATMGSAGRSIWMYGCAVYGGALGDAGVEAPLGMYSCTFAAGHRCYEFAGSKEAVGSVFLGSVNTTSKNPLTATGCLFAEGSVSDANLPYLTTNRCAVLPAEDLQFDGELRPVFGSCAAIDSGDNGLLCAELDGRDAFGNQRISNGTVDVGAVEYDWNPRYAADIGTDPERTSASPDVTEAAGAVRLVDGTELLTVKNAVAGKRVYVTVRVSGEGTLSIARGDEPFADVTSADGRKELKFVADSADERLRFAFAGTGSADVFSVEQGRGMLLIVR